MVLTLFSLPDTMMQCTIDIDHVAHIHDMGEGVPHPKEGGQSNPRDGAMNRLCNFKRDPNGERIPKEKESVYII